MYATDATQAIGFVENALATVATLEAELKQLRKLLKGKPTLEMEAKVPQVIDPAWFKNQTNRHLSEAGKRHLRYLLVDQGMNKNQAAVAMGIEPGAVGEWWKKWNLGSANA